MRLIELKRYVNKNGYTIFITIAEMTDEQGKIVELEFKNLIQKLLKQFIIEG